jgi:hypothetical protein
VDAATDAAGRIFAGVRTGVPGRDPDDDLVAWMSGSADGTSSSALRGRRRGTATDEAGRGRSTGHARTAHALVALVVVVSLVVQLVLLLSGGTDANTGDPQAEVPVGTRLVRLFSYFTIQSNLLVLAASVTLALDPRRDGRVWRVLRLDALLGITITGFVYWTLLAPVVDLHGAALASGLGFHLVSPVGALVVWGCFGPRPRVRWNTVAWAFAWPVAWVAYTFVRGALTGWYPYPFLDVAAVGYARALVATAVVLVLGLLVALVLKRFDRRRPVRWAG